jgi:hypothetical protein
VNVEQFAPGEPCAQDAFGVGAVGISSPQLSGTVSGAVTWPAISDRDAEQAKLERERPTAPTRLVVASAEAFPSLDLDRQRAIVDALVEAVVLAKAERRGSPSTPDRLEVVWRA